MLEARQAAIDSSAPPLELQLAFLAEQWGAPAILGPGQNLFLLARMGRLLSIYRVFKKSTRDGIKSLSSSEMQTYQDMQVMLVKEREKNG